jgi:hypothetical protein
MIIVCTTRRPFSLRPACMCLLPVYQSELTWFELFSFLYTTSYWFAAISMVLQQLIPARLVQKFILFYGIRRFITAFLYSTHWSLPWALYPVYFLTNVFLQIH